MEEKNEIDPWMIWVLFSITAVVHLPIVFWIGKQTQSHAQLTQSIIILGFSFLLLIIAKGKDLKLSCRFDNQVIYLLAASYVLSGINMVFTFGILSLVSICLAFLSFGIFLLGNKHKSILYGLFAAFFCFTLLIIFMPNFDWPLRVMAAKGSQFLLGLFGQESNLSLVDEGNYYRLLIFRDNQPFYVASECNGYGIMSASLLLSICLAIAQKVKILYSIGLILLAVAIAFIANGIRIVLIILLAPVVGSEMYDLMHETIGLLLLIGMLFLIWETFQKVSPKS